MQKAKKPGALGKLRDDWPGSVMKIMKNGGNMVKLISKNG
jgi:hypothetical protein